MTTIKDNALILHRALKAGWPAAAALWKRAHADVGVHPDAPLRFVAPAYPDGTGEVSIVVTDAHASATYAGVVLADHEGWNEDAPSTPPKRDRKRRSRDLVRSEVLYLRLTPSVHAALGRARREGETLQDATVRILSAALALTERPRG